MRKLKVTIDGIEQEISVSDEVYSAFMDPIWRKKKREQRRKLRKNEMDTIQSGKYLLTKGIMPRVKVSYENALYR